MRKFVGVVFSIFQFMLLPPLVVASGAWLLWGVDYALPAFLFAFGVDIIVGFCVNAFVSVRNNKIAADLEKERMDYERGQIIGVSCAKCGERNLVPLDMRIEGFTCKKCGQKNKLYYDFRAESIFDLQRSEFTKGQIAEKLKEDAASAMAIWDGLENSNG